MKTILLVFGTRPEAIKMAPLVKKLQSEPEKFKTVVCVTAQHRQMLDQVLHIFDIVPDYDLDIMKPNQDLYDVTARVLLGMRDVLKEVQPDVVLVHGDTTTSTAAALAAFYQQIPVGHVEAGLRTHNIYSPWPEEMNRQITGRITTHHFAPTPLAKQNLLRENVAENQIVVTGNTVIDALHIVTKRLAEDAELQQSVQGELAEFGYDVNRLNSGRKLVLITGHRRENFGEGFLNICHAIKNLAERYPDTDFVYPVHLNPNVRKPVFEILGDGAEKNIFLIEPLQYLPFVYMMERSYLILTDSGGVQEEAPGLGKPVLVMRNTTERPEAVEAGTVLLVGTDRAKIEQGVIDLMEKPEVYRKMCEAVNPYGDGLACGRIAEFLSSEEETDDEEVLEYKESDLDLCINSLSQVSEDIIPLYDEIERMILPQVDLDVIRGLTPMWMADTGRSAESATSSVVFEQMVRVVEATHNQNLTKILYWFDVEALLNALQDRIIANEWLLKEFYSGLSSEIEFAKNHAHHAGLYFGGDGNKCYVAANTIFVNIASAFDIIAKIAVELEKFSSYDFSTYPKMKSGSVLYNKNLAISPILKQSGMLFSEPAIVHQIEILRNEYVHNGPWDRRANIYYPIDENLEPLPPFMMMPDMSVDGNFVTVKNRKKFYAQGTKLNEELIKIVNSAMSVLSTTVAGLRFVAQSQTISPNVDETEATAKDLEKVYEKVRKILHANK